MADGPDFSSETLPSFQQLIDYFVESLYEPTKLKQLQTASRNAYAIGEAEGRAADRKAFADMKVDAGGFFERLERSKNEWLGPALAWLIGEILGIEVPPTALGGAQGQLGKSGVGRQVGDALFDALRGDEQELKPGTEGARRLMGMASHITLHGWFSGILLEKLEKFFSISGEIENIARLGEELVEAAGIGRIARVALRPIAQTLMATPLEWELHKQLRPTLLGDSTLAREMLRTPGDADQWREQFARKGHSDANILALVNEQRRFLSVGDVSELVTRGSWSNDFAVQHLVDQGYDEDTARDALRVEGARLIGASDSALVGAIVQAYADRRIEAADRDRLLASLLLPDWQVALAQTAAEIQRTLHVRHLSPAEARQGVIAGLLAFVDYEQALRLAGYTPDAVDGLELILRKELDEKRTAAEHRKQLAADRAAAAAARAQAAADRKQQIEAARALRQRGSIATLEQAYIRGLIPIARVEEVLAAEFDRDTVGIYVADLEDRRAHYTAQQAHAADAAKRAANRGLSVSELEAALVEGVLTVDEIRPQLEARGLSEADVSVLLHVMQDAAAAKQHAAALRAKAEQRAGVKTLSLTQAEALVKGGHWTLAQFDTFVAGLGYDAADVAALNGLLGDAIAKAKAAAAIRAATTAGNADKGLTLAQMRRGVVLGAITMADFQQFLVSQRYSAAAVATLVADAQDAANTADAARARRDAAAPASDGRDVPLATLTRAAQLGLLSPADYAAALRDRGYSDDAIALELDLLSTEIAAAKQPTPAPGTAEAGLAGGTGTPADAAAQRHVQVDGELAARGLSLATVEKSVKAGDTTIDQYTNWLEANGYGHGDAEILTSLLAAQLQG